MPDIAKPLTGFGSAVMELTLRCRGYAFRIVYIISDGDDICVVSAFQRKSKSGIKTPKMELDLTDQRPK